RERRIRRLRCHHSSSSVTGTPRTRAKRLRIATDGLFFRTVFDLPVRFDGSSFAISPWDTSPWRQISLRHSECARAATSDTLPGTRPGDSEAGLARLDASRVSMVVEQRGRHQSRADRGDFSAKGAALTTFSTGDAARTSVCKFL